MDAAQLQFKKKMHLIGAEGLKGSIHRECKNCVTHLGEGLISCPFLYHFRSTVGSARSTTRRIFPPLSTWYAGSSFFAKATKRKYHKSDNWLRKKNNFQYYRFTFAFLFFFRYFLHPPQQTPKICDSVCKGNLLVFIWPGVFENLPHINFWGILLLFRLSGEWNQGKVVKMRTQTGHCVLRSCSLREQKTILKPNLLYSPVFLNQFYSFLALLPEHSSEHDTQRDGRAELAKDRQG